MERHALDRPRRLRQDRRLPRDIPLSAVKTSAFSSAFKDAWARRETGIFGPEAVSYISREDLIKNKLAVGRPRDLDDVRELEAGRLGPPA
jgi:hypothetical protein